MQKNVMILKEIYGHGFNRNTELAMHIFSKIWFCDFRIKNCTNYNANTGLSSPRTHHPFVHIFVISNVCADFDYSFSLNSEKNAYSPQPPLPHYPLATIRHWIYVSFRLRKMIDNSFCSCAVVASIVVIYADWSC